MDPVSTANQGQRGAQRLFGVQGALLLSGARRWAKPRGLVIKGSLKVYDMQPALIAGLFAQHFAQEHAERTHVAAQGSFLQVAGLRFKLGQPLRPAFRIPKKGHRCLDYA